MSKNSPRVSIVIPVYNGANYMRQAIDSALAQTYQNIEVLVINDGSTDAGRTDEIARFYENKIHYFCKENGGVASALNLGIREMKGDCFAWLSHDDVFLPGKITSQIDFLNKNKEFAACYTDYFQIDAKGNILRKISTPWLPRQKALKKLFGHQYINGSTMMVKRECFDKAGVFDERWRYTQDMEMWLRLLQCFNIGWVNEPLTMQRLHGGQGSSQKRAHREEAIKLFEQLFDELGAKGLLDEKKWARTDAKKLAYRHIWFGRTVSRERGWYNIGKEHLKKATALWPDWRNPARFYLLADKKIFLYRRCQQIKVRALNWITTMIRLRSKKR